MTRRKSLSTKRRAEIFHASKGVCHICNGKIQAGEAWDVEHRVPLAMGGLDEDENLSPAHQKCHKVKTADDFGRIAKAKRVEAKHYGFKPKKQQSQFKRKLNGTVVWRDTGEVYQGRQV